MNPIDSLRRRGLLGALSAGVLGAAAVARAFAQSVWPGKLVRIVVPYTPGTGMDILARTLGPHLQAAWGQAIVVENRPGASGNLGAACVTHFAARRADALTGDTLIINPALYANMSYDPLKDLAPIGLAATGSFLLVASSASKLKSVDDLIKAARARPGSLDYASPGIATPHHMAMELFKLQAKVSITHIPFSGTAGAVNAVLSGDVPLMFLPVHVAMAQVKGGRLVVLAAAGDKRSALAPEVPTLAELGFKGVEADLWYGMLAPAGTPTDVVARINADMRKARPCPRWRPRSRPGRRSHEPPEETAALMRRDAARWAAVKEAYRRQRSAEQGRSDDEREGVRPLGMARASLRRMARQRRNPAALDADRRQAAARALALAQPWLAGAALRQCPRPRQLGDARRPRPTGRGRVRSRRPPAGDPIVRRGRARLRAGADVGRGLLPPIHGRASPRSTSTSRSTCGRTRWPIRFPFPDDETHAAYEPAAGACHVAGAGAGRPGVPPFPLRLPRQGEPGASVLGRFDLAVTRFRPAGALASGRYPDCPTW